MRNYIVYFLTSLFLLFIVESKLNVKTLQSSYAGNVSHHLPKKANRLNQTYDKLTIQQAADDTGNYSIEFAEDDFQLSDTLLTITVFASVFSLIYFFGLHYLKNIEQGYYDPLSKAFFIKKYILIRSIRI